MMMKNLILLIALFVTLGVSNAQSIIFKAHGTSCTPTDRLLNFKVVTELAIGWDTMYLCTNNGAYHISTNRDYPDILMIEDSVIYTRKANFISPKTKHCHVSRFYCFKQYAISQGGYSFTLPIDDYKGDSIEILYNSLIATIVEDSSLLSYRITTTLIEPSINKKDLIDDITFYPNPVVNVIMLSELSNVTIYSNIGTVVNKANNTNTLYVGDLTSGVYYIKVNDQPVKPFIKQ